MRNRIKRLFAFKQLKYGIFTAIIGLIPVILAIILFEIFIDVSPYDRQIKLLQVCKNYDIRMILYYITSGFSHIIICCVVVGHFLFKSNKNSPILKLKLLKKIRLSVLLILIFLVFILDKIHLNLAYLSHDRLYILLGKSDFFINILKSFPKDFFHFVNIDLFHVFSIFPFILISLALAVMIFGSFFIGRKLYEFLDQKDIPVNSLKEYILELKSILKKYTQLLSIVLVSSTIATILFFLVPISLLENSVEKNNYIGVSIAMGVCWGIIFSLTLFFLCIYPYSLVHKKITQVIQQNRVKEDLDLEKWIYDNTSYFSLMADQNFILSIISPAIPSIFSAVISSGFMQN